MGNLHLSKFSVSEPSNQSANALWKFNLLNSWRLREVKYENRQFIFTTLFNSGQLHYLMSRVGLDRILVSPLIGSMRLSKFLFTLGISLAVISCATVRKQDLDAWVGVPVEALDTHSFFITVPVYRSITSSGIEIRNYANGKDIASCFSNASGNLLMWAHYAQDHKGAVFELWSLPDEDNHLSVATPVDYSDDPIPFFTKKEWVDDLVGLKRLDITSLYKRYACTKSKNWAYEREWRVWYPLSKTDKYDFSPIRQAELRAVYLGCQAEASFKSDILRLIANRYPETRVFQAKKKINAYALKYTDVI